jgi:hypothetical protein
MRIAQAGVRMALSSLFLFGCPQKEPMQSMAPAPLPTLEPDRGVTDGSSEDLREGLFRVEPVPAWGDELPLSAQPLYVEATTISVGRKTVKRLAPDWSAQVLGLLSGRQCAVLLDSDPERYLADLADLLELLATRGCEVWLRHPDAPVAFKVTLRDNVQFERWLVEPQPGKIRVIQRADGFEIQTNIGKMAGSDPNGPTVPARGGKVDVGRLRRALGQLKERFSNAPDSCLVPSYGIELASIAQALSGYYRAEGKRIFNGLCLVYPQVSRLPSDGGDR